MVNKETVGEGRGGLGRKRKSEEALLTLGATRRLAGDPRTGKPAAGDGNSGPGGGPGATEAGRWAPATWRVRRKGEGELEPDPLT